MKFFGIIVLSLLPFCAFAQQKTDPKADEKAEKELREYIDKQVESLGETLELEDWQMFYVDSILTHDYTAMRDEIKSMSASKVSNSALYERVQDKWTEQTYQALIGLMDDEQAAKYNKMGAARDKKARDKRMAKYAK